MRSCNVDEFEYHRPEELPILCRYNFGGQFFYSFLITTRFCCIIVDYQDGRPPPFFFPFLSKICLILQFLDLSNRISEAISLYVFLLSYLCIWIPVGIRTSWAPIVIIIIAFPFSVGLSWYYPRNVTFLSLLCSVFLRAFVPDTTLQPLIINLEHWKL